MSEPRCGNPDKYQGEEESGRVRRFAATSGWGRPDITWNIVNYTQDLPKKQVDDSLESAFKVSSWIFGVVKTKRVMKYI